ncbi:uncharacterized protein N7503_006483 [Penicillium pulvis]|uniref:uncharacterized protein n=1 Tax=Penicillium pulvis TaxID=1562058 RepID=UPI002548D51F|nr:uncharacterized protein N7503_006483 [Penicillium pulvis]KAJ5798978.1 hypothetical protein N7503_006483 [Penicillium pulvis]
MTMSLRHRQWAGIMRSAHINVTILRRAYKRPRSRANGYRLLFLDGHEPHMKYDFISYCQQNRILMYCFPSKLTHRLNPPILSPSKHISTTIGGRTIGLDDGVDQLQIRRIRFECRLSTSTVRHAFKHCGLWPFNPEVICQDLQPYDGPDLVVYDRGKEYELPEWNFHHSRPVPVEERGEEDRETPPPASSSTITQFTTNDSRKIAKKNITTARESFPNNDSPESNKLKRRAERICQGSLLQAQPAAQRTGCKPNAKSPKRQSSKGGALQVRDSNTLIWNRDIVEAEQQRRKYEREAKELGAEMLRRAETRDQENQRRDAEFDWVTGDDNQPLYTIDNVSH